MVLRKDKQKKIIKVPKGRKIMQCVNLGLFPFDCLIHSGPGKKHGKDRQNKNYNVGTANPINFDQSFG